MTKFYHNGIEVNKWLLSGVIEKKEDIELGDGRVYTEIILLQRSRGFGTGFRISRYMIQAWQQRLRKFIKNKVPVGTEVCVEGRMRSNSYKNEADEWSHFTVLELANVLPNIGGKSGND